MGVFLLVVAGGLEGMRRAALAQGAVLAGRGLTGRAPDSAVVRSRHRPSPGFGPPNIHGGRYSTAESSTLPSIGNQDLSV